MTVLKWFLSFEPPVKKIIVFHGAVQESSPEQTLTIPDTLLLNEKDPATILLKATFSPREISRSGRGFTSDIITIIG